MRFFLTRRRAAQVLLVALAVLLLGGTAGAAYAAGHRSNTIKVCVAHTSGTLYRHARCKRGDSTLSWNVTGPRGPAGRRGPAGQPATSLWALVKAGSPPSLIYSKGVSSVSGSSGTTLVTFDQNVSKCASVATPASAGGGFFTEHPTAQISEEFYPNGWGADGETVGVIIVDNSQTDPVGGYDFSVAAFC